MSSDDAAGDALAPVTDLFGARSPRRRSPSHPAGSRLGVDGATGERPGGSASDPVAGSASDPVAGSASAPSEWRAPVTGAATGPRLRAVVPVAEVAAASAAVVARGAGARPGGRGADGRAATAGAADRAPESDDVSTDDDLRRDAERVSMRTLSRRGVSEHELRAALVRAEIPTDVIEAEVERLTRVGLLDDATLAADLVERLHDRKGLGRQGVVAELRRRGIDPGVIEAALEPDDDDEQDAEAARANELAERRAPQLRGLDRATAERRLSGFLMRKGYSGSVVRQAVTRALDGARPRGGVRFE